MSLLPEIFFRSRVLTSPEEESDNPIESTVKEANADGVLAFLISRGFNKYLKTMMLRNAEAAAEPLSDAPEESEK